MNPTRFLLLACLFLSTTFSFAANQPMRIATFSVDATPPLGSPLAYDPMIATGTPLSCKGIVIYGDRKPVILCAVDWIGIGSSGQIAFKEAFAEAVGTDPERVTVHTLHQHDAPRCNFAADDLLKEQGLTGMAFNVAHARKVIRDAAAAAKAAPQEAITHVGHGTAEVKEIASNRRIMGPDGKVRATRWTACRSPELRALPVGTIDPELSTVSFWFEDECRAVLSYYACHPQSYYRTGAPSPDFPGLARNQREEESGIPHIHFNGAGGNIGAGKWNDGSKENRPVLVNKLATAMKESLNNTKKQGVNSGFLHWHVEPVLMPPSTAIDEAALRETISNIKATPAVRYAAAKELDWYLRCQRKEPVNLTCLQIGSNRVLHMPGELLVEYQLWAKEQKPNLSIAMAAYGDYSMGYIAPSKAYDEGGYEASARASKVAPEVEGVLKEAMKKLLSR